MDCQCESVPWLGHSNRGFLVKHDVPAQKITAEAVAGEGALGLYTQRMLSLCIRAAWWTNSTLCACVRVKDKTHLCQTHLCGRILMSSVQQSRRQWVWAVFGSVTVFNIIPLRVLREPEQGPIPGLWLQGFPLFFTRNTDIITSFKEPPHLAFSLPLCLIQVSCPHVSSDRYSHPGLNPNTFSCWSASKESCTYANRPLCLQRHFVFFFIWPPWSHSSVKRCDFPVNYGHWVVFLLIIWVSKCNTCS